VNLADHYELMHETEALQSKAKNQPIVRDISKMVRDRITLVLFANYYPFSTPTGSTNTQIKYIQNTHLRKKSQKLDIHENTNTLAIKGNCNIGLQAPAARLQTILTSTKA